MTKNLLLLTLAAAAVLPGSAENIKIKGILNNNRYDDGDQLKSEYVGWNSELGKAIFIVDYGIYAMTWDGNTLSTPIKEPAVNKSEIQNDNDLQKWATNFNLMYGNSGAVHIGDKLVTVMSRDYQSTPDEELFAVRKWNANTGDLLNSPEDYMPVSANIESAGMSYNPKDGKVYGFFHITDALLLDEITSDEDYFTDQDDIDWGRENLDDGYCLGTIDLSNMSVTPITPGLYYGNFVAFAINNEGRAFVLTSGGTTGYMGDDGKIYNVNHELTGARLIEIDTATGLMIRNSREVTDPITGDTYIEYTYPLPATGYCSQVRRQAACFSKSNPNKFYWVGFYNSGKGVSSTGSWTTLDNREWRTNGLFDTALYEIDINTGECNRLAKVPNRCSFSCIWLDGDDASEDVAYNFENSGVENTVVTPVDDEQHIYDLSGREVSNPEHGFYIIKEGNTTRKVMIP